MIFNEYLLQKMTFGEFVERYHVGSILTGVSWVGGIMSVFCVPGAEIVNCSAKLLRGKLSES